jgi:hypothetical protein
MLHLTMRMCIAVAISVGVALPAICAAAEDTDLRWIPGTCNAIAVVRMRQLVDSQLGKKEKWSDRARRAFTAGLWSAPTFVNEVVRGTVIPSGPGGSPLYAIYSSRRESGISEITRRERARGEKILGHMAVLSPRIVYFVQLAPGIVGAMQPPNREQVSRWIEASSEKASSQISPYLREAIELDDGAQVSIAIDLAGRLSRRRVQEWINGSSALRARRDRNQVAFLLGSLKGVRLSVLVTSAIRGRVRLDFAAPVGENADGLKAAILAWLDDAGGRVELLSRAKAAVADNSIVLEAPLDTQALRRLMSLIESPSPFSEEGTTEKVDVGKPNGLASAAYYESVYQLLKDLDRKNQNASNYEKTALWHETFARKIDDLPTADVDPDLPVWGHAVSEQLRALAASLRGMPAQVDSIRRSVRFDTKTYNRMYAIGPDGPLYNPSFVETSNNLSKVRANLEEAVSKNGNERDSIWAMINDGTAAIRQKIEEKYHIQLAKPR